MNEVAVPLAAVRKSVTVPIAPERAFELFVSEIGTWWPLATHSVGLKRSIGVSCGTSVGDEMVETLSDGTTSVWGTVLESDPPHLIVAALVARRRPAAPSGTWPSRRARWRTGARPSRCSRQAHSLNHGL
jgi:hypothetical protein